MGILQEFTFGERIKHMREVKEVKVKDLAEIVGCWGTDICRWQQDERYPKISHLIKMADFFDVSVDWLFGRTEKTETAGNKPTDEMTFGQRLKSKRVECKLRQADLARNAQVGISSLYLWEYDKRETTAFFLLLLAEELNVSADWLLGRTDRQEINR